MAGPHHGAPQRRELAAQSSGANQREGTRATTVSIRGSQGSEISSALSVLIR